MIACKHEEVREYAQAKFNALSSEIRRHILTATYDVYFGPYDEDQPDGDDYVYPGFSAACRAIRAALDDVGEIWYNEEWGGIVENEPDYGYQEDTGEWIEEFGWHHYERSDILKMIVGKELYSYL